jgi:uncharacterized damage-inducible protein DinB
MTLILHNINKLSEIKSLLTKLPKELYAAPKKVLSNASIGQHFRHILEFYTSLEKGAKTGTVCYDDRKRNELIETYANHAENSVEKSIDFLNSIEADGPLKMRANYATSEEQSVIQTSLYRELAYALDHTIHHLAIIKIALLTENKEIKLDSDFGVAPSTIRYQKQGDN